MKRILSVLLAMIILLTPCIAFAYNIEEDNIKYAYCDEINGSLFVRIAFDDKYKTFADDVRVTLVHLDENYQEVSSHTYSGGDIICLTETTYYANSSESPVIYIPHAERLKDYTVAIRIPENTVYDSEGHGNKETAYSLSYLNNFYNGTKKFYTSNKKEKYPYSIKDTVTYELSFPVDFYLNDTLASENSLKYSLYIKSSGKYKVEAKKYGVTIKIDDFDTKEKKEENLESLKSGLEEVLTLNIMSPILCILAPVIPFPPLFAAALVSPFLALFGDFVILKDFLYLITH